jgi:hypothetical protein
VPTASKLLSNHVKHRDLVSIRRENIDGFGIQGFLLDFSDTLILLQYIHDFRLDGYLVLRLGDISQLKSSATDRFQKGLLRSEGIFDQVDFGFRAAIQSFDAFLASRPSQEIVIVEDEIHKPQKFLIGTVARVDKDAAWVNHFTGTARLAKPIQRIRTNRITSCQIHTNYTLIYERHFVRATSIEVPFASTS